MTAMVVSKENDKIGLPCLGAAWFGSKAALDVDKKSRRESIVSVIVTNQYLSAKYNIVAILLFRSLNDKTYFSCFDCRCCLFPQRGISAKTERSLHPV
jgi:hypothetical protein